MIIIALSVLLFRKTKQEKELVHKFDRLDCDANKIRAILSAIPDPIYCKDNDSRYVCCNPAFQQFIGLSEQELLGKRMEDILPVDPPMAQFYREDEQRIIQNNLTETKEEWIDFPDGERRLVETVRAPFHRRDGEAQGIVSISRDITARKAAEDAKTQFLSHMSHEIRTPLNAIIGLSQTVRQIIVHGDRTKALEYINKVILSSQHLLGILNDVLDLSKIESGKMEISPEAHSVKTSYREIIDMVQQQCDRKNISFVHNLEATDERIISVDKLRVNQVLINLLGNAIKFTPPGGTVFLGVHIVGETDKDVSLHFSVQDTGIGMTEGQISRLFNAFDQTDDSISARFGGTGLGLTISQSIVRLMGGEIMVESTHGEGSRFYFELTFPKTELPQEDETIQIPNLTGRRILLVEDMETNRMVIDAMLCDTGVTIDEAVDGLQGVEVFSQSIPGTYDLIFMDVQMPNMDGHQATRAIRALPHPQAQTIPIIAMTANSFQEDIDKALACGMNGHIAKPVDYQKLLTTLAPLGQQFTVSRRPAV